MPGASESLALEKCNCPDCETAVSPAAYLTALLDFAFKHIRNNQVEKLDFALLEKLFLQPFSQLPTSCGAVEKQVNQVRLCIEVLRHYIGKRPLLEQNKEQQLRSGESEYLFTLYSFLLTKIGTSYEEMRRARTDLPENRAALAERLAMQLSAGASRPDELDQLFLNWDATPPAAGALSEDAIEQLFGLPSTFRDPLSQGAKVGDEANQITRWNLVEARWNETTDEKGTVYLTLTNPNPGEYLVQVFKDADRTIKMAEGKSDNAIGTVTLVPEPGNKLSGVLHIAYTTDTASVSLVVIPYFLCGQLKKLRTFWKSIDHPETGYYPGSSLLPIIDPDLIGPDDFRFPFDTNDAFKLWITRRKWIDETLSDIKEKIVTDGVQQTLQDILGNPLPDFENLPQQEISLLGLNQDSVKRLHDLQLKDFHHVSNPTNEALTKEDNEEICSLLTQISKAQKWPAWKAGEESAGIKLGPVQFHQSITAPVEGVWPAIRPMIDPDLLKLTELPDGQNGNKTRILWNKRKETLSKHPQELQTVFEASGFEALLRKAFNMAVLPDLDDLKNKLLNPDDSVRNNAIQQIESSLHLTADQFQTVLNFQSKSHPSSPVKPSKEEHDQLFQVLSAPYKITTYYPTWQNEEQALKLEYWDVLKARLPKWRATIEGRQNWTLALKTASAPPIVDPDIIGLENIAHLTNGDPAFDLYIARSKEIKKWHEECRNKREAEATPDQGLKTILKEYLGIGVDELTELEKQQAGGKAIEKRLEQLNLSYGSFSYLLRMWFLVQAGAQLTESEWDLIYNTLTRVKKERAFGDYHDQERASSLPERQIILSPDFFRLPSGPGSTQPPIPSAIWLTTTQRKMDWSGLLQSRIDQQNATIAALESTISAAEEIALPILRDALILSSDASGSNLQAKAKWITGLLQIDASAGGCTATTRVAQAIETIQGIIFGLRTSQLIQNTPEKLMAITAVSRNGTIDLVGLSEDNVLWSRQQDVVWRNWKPVGALPVTADMGNIPGRPTLISKKDDELDVFIIGRDRALWQKSYNGAWSEWVSLGGEFSFSATPVVVSREAGSIDVFGLNNEAKLLWKTYSGGNWSDWKIAGGPYSRTPAAVSLGVNNIVLLTGRPSPDLFATVQLTWDGASWTETSLDGLLSSDPVAASWSAARMDLLVNSGGTLKQKSWNGTWQNWGNIGPLPNTGTSNPYDFKLAVCAPASEKLNLYASLGNQLWEKKFDYATGWSAWELIENRSLSLLEDHFEEEWKWIGAYATYRAATFVQLYPDNILDPTLLYYKTPVFQHITEELQSSALPPKTALRMASSYSDYLYDVYNLDIEATCQVYALNKYGSQVFMFARPNPGKSKIYWSAIDPLKTKTPYPQTFWTKLKFSEESEDSQSFQLEKIVGAVAYEVPYSKQRFLFLFVSIREAGGRKLKYIKLPAEELLANPTTHAELSDLPLPGEWNWNGDTIKVVQSDNSRTSVPKVAVLARADKTTGVWDVYVKALKESGDGWENEDWGIAKQQIRYISSGGIGGFESVHVLLAALEVAKVTWLIFRNHFNPHAPGLNIAQLKAYPLGGGGSLIVASGDAAVNYIGALPSPHESSPSAVIVFFKEGDKKVYRRVQKNGILGTKYVTVSDLRDLPNHSGDAYPAATFVYKSNTYNRPSFLFKYARHDDQLVSEFKIRVTPGELPLFQVKLKASAVELQSKRISLKKSFESLKGSSDSVMIYLYEAYYFLPVLLGLKLQAAGFYVEALDCFRTVYDFSAKLTERYIYYGLELNAQLPDDQFYQNANNWLLDPLNPHYIASTRRNAYVRYTLMCIIRCLNEFGDSLFTNDTPESVPRARMLYETALTLCDLPVLQQSLKRCETLLGELVIDPGADVPPEAPLLLAEIKESLTKSGLLSTYFVNEINSILVSEDLWSAKISAIQAMLSQSAAQAAIPLTPGTIVAQSELKRKEAHTALMMQEKVVTALKNLASVSPNI